MLKKVSVYFSGTGLHYSHEKYTHSNLKRQLDWETVQMFKHSTAAVVLGRQTRSHSQARLSFRRELIQVQVKIGGRNRNDTSVHLPSELAELAKEFEFIKGKILQTSLSWTGFITRASTK